MSHVTKVNLMTTNDYENFSNTCARVSLTHSQWMQKEDCAVKIQAENLSRLVHGRACGGLLEFFQLVLTMRCFQLLPACI
eukprot:CAMPEP_0113655976 /NCGR_PEP_ID=MMETSP0017_2-20120614/30044_1 /TAXON_ID=2856 /ORGANISM="Cylindrotheca closterium" /LENGTH=79 /DNA_ID=CAMNT_0000569361 /DNA_START=54 /DNA_END=290 /DNA_ORIENTATION=- /assembly_acc=CAM_ASM_000147